MPITASQILAFLEQHENFCIDRYEIASSDFGLLRRSLRQIALKFCDSDDQLAIDVLDGLRTLLSEWLTIPVPFERSMLSAIIDLFGEADVVQARWGSDIRTAYETALRAGESLVTTENPMRERLRSFIEELLSQRLAFKFYCHRRAQLHFESLLPQPEEKQFLEEKFIHSLREYRDSGPFDLLIKVGPLRAHGWGSAPDAVVTAPRFDTLAHFVWSGSSDDSNFGYDPISPVIDGGRAQTSGKGSDDLKWTTRVIRYGDDPGAGPGDDSDIDDLRFLQNIHAPRDKRSATLIQIDDEHGILYPPYSQVLSFDPDPAAAEPIDRRIPDETLHHGMFLIRPSLDDVDLGGVAAEIGSCSQIWKDRLEDELRSDADGLINRLRKAGLKLVHLRSAIEHWCKPPTSVIHAPQRMKHFEILIQVLGLEKKGDAVQGREAPSWWQLAWIEIRRSRGEAIHSGFLEKEIVEEQLLVILRDLLPQIREKAVGKVGFRLGTPPRSDMHGEFLLSPVIAIEHGFHAPDSELKMIQDLTTTDKWRD